MTLWDLMMDENRMVRCKSVLYVADLGKHGHVGIDNGLFARGREETTIICKLSRCYRNPKKYCKFHTSGCTLLVMHHAARVTSVGSKMQLSIRYGECDWDFSPITRLVNYNCNYNSLVGGPRWCGDVSLTAYDELTS